MQPTGPKKASFSPYHDEDRLSDFLDSDAQRLSANAAIVFFVHVGLVLSLSGNFIVPDLKPPLPPKAVSVEIVTFDPQPEPEAAPIIIEPTPTPTPQAPVAKPQPKPQPRPEPIPEPIPVPIPVPIPELPQPEPEPLPEPIPEPLPEPEPVPVFTPPPPLPEILVQPETLEPDPVPAPMLRADPIPEPEPMIEVLEPLPEPIPTLELEPSLEFNVPAPIPEAIPEAEPIPELDPLPSIDFFEPAPIVEPEPIFEPIIIQPELPPTAGAIEAEPLPELIDLEPLPLEIIIEPILETRPEPAPQPLPEIAPELTPDAIPQPDIIFTAPTVLASPDAPESREEEIRAVPQEQSDPFVDLIKRDRGSTLNEPVVPRQGGGNKSPMRQGSATSAPPGGGTQLGRTAPGSAGWSLAPQAAGPGQAYEGISLDMRCREEGRTHEDCPEYLRTLKGRDRTGREDFEGHAGTGSDRGERLSNTRTMPSRSQIGLNIGDPSVNSGGPSTSAMDSPDLNFDREFLGGKIVTEPPKPGLLGISGAADSSTPKNDWQLNTPTTPEADEDADNSINWILNTSPEE